MTVHSHQLGFASGVGSTSVTLYTCPAGKRTIVKSFVIQNNSGSSNRVTLTLSLVAGGTMSWAMTLAASAAAGESINYECWVVMNAGDVLKASAASASIRLIASGAELTV